MIHKEETLYVKNLFEKVGEENKKSIKWFTHDIAQKIEIGGKKV
jgi:hypothetical protein